jgi:hypothetical protein
MKVYLFDYNVFQETSRNVVKMIGDLKYFQMSHLMIN